MFKALNIFDTKKLVVVCIISYVVGVLYYAIAYWVGMRLGLWAMK